MGGKRPSFGIGVKNWKRGSGHPAVFVKADSKGVTGVIGVTVVTFAMTRGKFADSKGVAVIGFVRVTGVVRL